MLTWLADIQSTQPIAHGVIILSLVAAIGLALGSIRVRGFSLGIAGTLFAGLIFAHFGYNLEPSFRSFIQEFGLILFVYTIGPQGGTSNQVRSEVLQARPQPQEGLAKGPRTKIPSLQESG